MQSVRPDESTPQRHIKLFEKLSDTDKESSEVGAEDDVIAVVKMLTRIGNFIVKVDSDLNRKSRKRRRKGTRNELRTWRANTEWLTKFIIQRIQMVSIMSNNNVCDLKIILQINHYFKIAL